MKYYLKNGTKVSVGDTITLSREKKTDLGVVTKTTTLTVTENNIPLLIKKGIIFKPDYKEFTAIDEVKNSLAAKNNMSPEAFNAFFTVLESVDPTSAFMILMKELAENANKKRDDLTYCFMAYYVDIYTGKVITCLYDSTCSEYNKIFFKSNRDLHEALDIVKPLYNKAFGKE